ncbi:homoserine dehydrogenase [Burkholderiaceae bacterium FT117]|uniref:NAD(P)H-dependent oxidoreductase n=1 Tax=Zeimonas sediminis TaxID=2944268 RepID=UPI002342E584|nr:homoserine dehydrogenase [Zeimonas sediminis]MCM5571765.1 homoserine dehydrogenase [Zeimonas sediminis]
MNLHSHFSRIAQRVETCLVGAGSFGRSFVAQGMKTPKMCARVAVDVRIETVEALYRDLGAPADRIRACRTADEARAAWEQGAWIAAEDLAVVLPLPIDVVVEATGHPEAGARHSEMAVQAGKHLVLVSKEVDSVVGPILFHLARERGRTVTPVDGDQPSLLIGLVTWAETLGFEIVAAGKSSEYDFVFDSATGMLESNGREIHAPGFAGLMAAGERDMATLLAERSRLAAELPQRTVPDLCEMLVVGNATGLVPDTPAFHSPILRIDEAPTVFTTRDDGGLLSGTRRLDVFNCLRTPGELSFAGGVFVVVRCDDPVTWQMLAEKGHVLGRNRNTALLWLPRHLLGLEAATSVLGAAIGEPTGGVEPAHRLDLVAVASRDLDEGTMLDAVGHHHSIAGVGAELRRAGPLAPGAPMPYYLVANRRLLRPVARGQAISVGDVELDPGSRLVALRALQDEIFFGKDEPARKA